MIVQDKEHLSNNPAVLLLSRRGIEQTRSKGGQELIG